MPPTRPLALGGLHHLTAITRDGRRNHAFYAGTLGLRLVKKTVNQDDVSAYHLFYADGKGAPGTDITFFVWPAAPERRGTRSITRTGLRVRSDESLAWWEHRLRTAGVPVGALTRRNGRATLDVEDPEGQRLALVVDGTGGSEHTPWQRSPVPAEHQILGLGPITMSVPKLEPTEATLTQIMGLRKVARASSEANDGADLYIFRMPPEGAAAELHVTVDPTLPPAHQGAGAVHHVAFRTTDAGYDAWTRHLVDMGVRNSGPIDRYYFRSLYFREPSGVLFEIATDGPGFAVDEPAESMGERLALPPFLEPRRAEIEAGLEPI